MKKKAWTLVELFLAMGIIILISSFLLTTFKPNTQKSKVYIYAAMNNLTKGIISVMEKYGEDATTSKTLTYQNPDSTDDTFCLELADVFSLAKEANCEQSEPISTVNLEFPNEVTIQGLATPWKTPYEGCEYNFKNIIIDVDGEKGLNKLGIDRFPLRIFQGGKVDGVIMPINCEDDSVYDEEGNKIVLTDSTGKSPFCKQKFDSSGALFTKNLLLDDKIINYDIYRSEMVEEKSVAKIVSSAQSLAMADCMAYGGYGYLSKEQCAQMGIKIHTKCASSETCEKCAEVSPTICPLKEDGITQTDFDGCMELVEANKVNGEEVKCFTIQHRPMGGASFLLESIIGEIN